MNDQLSGRTLAALKFLFPTDWLRPESPAWLVEQLVDAEMHRRGAPDATGAFHALALKEGALLKEEYDLSTHGHGDGWVIGAVVVDARELTVFNERHGFPAGDAALAAMVRAMKSVCATAKVVRTHTDGFAVLLGPTSGERVQPELASQLRAAMTVAVEASSTEKPLLTFTIGCLELTVVDPPNWQLLGPLVWSECERALVRARRAPSGEVLRRRLDLQGRLDVSS